MNNFEKFKLSEPISRALDILEYNKPTEVQDKVIPLIFENRDIIVKSYTGSGKTAAFAIPICERLNWEENKPQALVITPTRELALQVKEDFFNIGRYKRLKIASIFGKSPFNIQKNELKQKTHVVVGTPGRLIDHIEKETIDLSMIKYLIIDEADEMLRMGFVEQIEQIIEKLPKERMSVLLSATLPEDIERICLKYLQNPILVNIEEEDTALNRISQKVIIVDELEKFETLRLVMIKENPNSSIIFCNTQREVEELFKQLNDDKIFCGKIHGGMLQKERISVMNKFKRGYFRHLVATDVAARGIDVEKIELIINYDIPNTEENYVHRIGRTGRIGTSGKAITIAYYNELFMIDNIEEYIEMKISREEADKAENIKSLEEIFYTKNRVRPDLKEDRGEKLNKGITRIHINAGKKTKMRAVDIVGTICSIEGIKAEDIGVIEIRDISTFVEILNNKGDKVLKVLQDKTIKGRKRKVSRAERKEV
jgi:superfamily II DNA/RNA helicase